LPSWVAWLLAHLHIRIEDVSVSFAYDMRELDRSGALGGEAALMCSLGTLCFEPSGDGSKTTITVLALGLAMLLPDSDPQPILQELGLRFELVHGGSLLRPSAVAVAVGAGEGLRQPIAMEVDAGRIRALAAAQEVLCAGFVLHAARRRQRERAASQAQAEEEQDFMDASSMLPPPSRSPLHQFAEAGTRATVAAAGMQLVLNLDGDCNASQVGVSSEC